MKKISSHAHKTGFWYLLGVLLKIFDEHSTPFYMGVSRALDINKSDIRLNLRDQKLRIVKRDLNLGLNNPKKFFSACFFLLILIFTGF